MKFLILGLAVMAITIGGARGQGVTPPPAADSNVVPMPAANWLFVQVGDSYASDGKTLTIRGVAPQTLMFSDRPERMTGDALTTKFIEFWGKGRDDFEKDPPNATISTVIDDKTDLVVVELLNPRLTGDTLTYDIKALQGQLPATGKQISLFIDWWYGPGWHGRWRGGWGGGPPPYRGGRCWRGPYGALHCRPYWAN